MTPEDRAAVDEKASVLAVLATFTVIEHISSVTFSKIHGPKMDGPHNDTERALLNISEMARVVCNQLTNDVPIDKVNLEADV